MLSSVMNIEHVATVLVQFSFATTVYSLIAAWYIWPRLRALPIAGALLPLLLLQAFRYLGLVFLISPVIGEELPRQFSVPVAFGDLATSILAIVACIKLRYGWRGGVAFAWAANILGAADFLYGYTLGIGLQIPLGVAYYIPTLFNPAMFVAHFMAFVLLVKHARRPGNVQSR